MTNRVLHPFRTAAQPPFYSRDLSEMCYNILNKPLKLRTNISASARKILEGVSELYDLLLSSHRFW